jgi:hypothetical protein
MTNDSPPKPQADKFRDLARDLECDEDEKAFEETVRKVANPTNTPKKAGHWRVDFAVPNGHRANFYSEDGSDGWRSSDIFSTPEQVEDWLRANHCKQDAADPAKWYDQ